MDYKKEIIKTLKSMSGKYTEYQIFSDWVAMSAISFRNACHLLHNDEWQRWENHYLELAKKYDEKELSQIGYMTACLTMALEKNMEDVLGEVFMESGLGSSGTGQFFTPFSVSQLMARLTLDIDNLVETLAEGEHIKLHEPSSGAGGMVIATCSYLHLIGFDYQRRLDVICQDLDWRAVYMTYLQLSLIGCRAIVIQGNTLTDPYNINYDKRRCMKTPAMMGLIM